MASLKDLLGLFFSFADCDKSKSSYARQTMQLKKLVLEYGIEDLEKVLRYISEHKEEYKISSLAFIPYIYISVMSKLYEGEGKKEVEYTKVTLSTGNSIKAKRFGQKSEEWSDMFEIRKRQDI